MPAPAKAGVNQWYVDNAGKNSKHVFAGTTRIATKLEMPPKSQPPSQQPPGPGTGTTEKFFYFYHPDHLGSTSYVTDQSGEVYQHLEYFPFGETWVDESPGNSTDRTPYRFTGKELDEETQLYYFGARYYDPRTSLWTATDPALGEYLDVAKPVFASPSMANDWRVHLAAEGMGGAFEPKNMSVASYGHQNPLKVVDADGRILPLILGGLYLADKAYAAYEAHQDYKAIQSGEKTVAEVAQQRAGEQIAGAVGGALGRLGAKAIARYGDTALDALKGVFRKGGCSFDASTLVATKDGLKRIDRLFVNELVLAKNEETGETGYKPITDMFVNTHEETVRLTLRRVGGEHKEGVLSSINHPFFVVGRGWLSVSELAVGDKIETSEGAWARLLGKTVEPNELRAFSLEVADHHTFYVGESQAWVHNATLCNPKSVKQFGHTFTEHGAGSKNTARLKDRAQGTKKPQGQWLDDQKAADFLGSIGKVDGPAEVRLPEGMGQVIMPDGSIVKASRARLVPRDDGGLRSAFPVAD